MLSPSPARADASAPWDANAQGHFITCFCRDTQNRLWVGTEDGQGLWSYDPAAKAWTHFPASSDLSGDIYAVACDKSGRIWAGGLSGVSVYNGREWKQYGPTDGPLGTRLFALAVSPKDGGVWGATEAGLFRYANSHWTYFTRADGLPSDQAQALAFDKDGTLYVGTQCDGVAVGSPDNDYKTWRVTPGPATLPNSATGTGLPSGLINALLVAQGGTVYAGTDNGLAESSDGGEIWHFSRGVDWKAKLAGLYHPAPPDLHPFPGDLLSEDYITRLGEDASGRIWIGHRQTGVEAFDPKTGRRVQSGANGSAPGDYVSALLVAKQSAWVGLYGGGLLPPDSAETAASVPSAASVPPASVPPLPVPAAPPTLAELNAMLARVNALKREMPVGGGAYLGPDWRTQGDWVGRYGRQYAVLCAVASPMDQVLTWGQGYAADGSLGPHVQDNDKLRHWIMPGRVNTDLPAALYSPVDGFRTQAEWDDHGETYAQASDGPGLWVRVRVPAGIHRLSFYFDETGRGGGVNNRDYVVELKAGTATGLSTPGASQEIDFDRDRPDALPTLAHARVVSFLHGMYQQFIVRGPAQYFVKIDKNNSWNTMCAGVFIDKVAGPASSFDKMPMAFMSIIHYDPPNPDVPKETVPSSATVTAARSLWLALNADYGSSASAAFQSPYRVLALRAALAAKAPDNLINNWKWNLDIWSDDDRETFLNYMKAGYGNLRAHLNSYQ